MLVSAQSQKVTYAMSECLDAQAELELEAINTDLLASSHLDLQFYLTLCILLFWPSIPQGHDFCTQLLAGSPKHVCINFYVLEIAERYRPRP